MLRHGAPVGTALVLMDSGSFSAGAPIDAAALIHPSQPRFEAFGGPLGLGIGGDSGLGCESHELRPRVEDAPIIAVGAQLSMAVDAADQAISHYGASGKRPQRAVLLL